MNRHAPYLTHDLLTNSLASRSCCQGGASTPTTTCNTTAAVILTTHSIFHHHCPGAQGAPSHGIDQGCNFLQRVHNKCRALTATGSVVSTVCTYVALQRLLILSGLHNCDGLAHQTTMLAVALPPPTQNNTSFRTTGHSAGNGGRAPRQRWGCLLPCWSLSTTGSCSQQQALSPTMASFSAISPCNTPPTAAHEHTPDTKPHTSRPAPRHQPAKITDQELHKLGRRANWQLAMV